MRIPSNTASLCFKLLSRLRFSLVLAVVFIIGCSSANTALTYYVLHSVDASQAALSKEYTYLKLDRFVIPEYMKQRGLVYQTSETNIHISTTHLWAEPVDVGIKKSLKQVMLKRDIYLVDEKQYQESKTIHVALHINDFISRFDGDVLLTGEFMVLSSASVPHPSASSIIPFNIRVPLQHDGFSASIDAMRASLTQLATRIVDDVQVMSDE